MRPATVVLRGTPPSLEALTTASGLESFHGMKSRFREVDSGWPTLPTA